MEMRTSRAVREHDFVLQHSQDRAIGPVFSRLGAHRIILVTSNFHSRRVALVFRLFLPGFRFRVETAPDLKFDPNSWWKIQPGQDLLLSEYKKLLGKLAVRAAHPAWN